MASTRANGVNSFTDDNGQPLAGGSLYTYAAGTSTFLPAFADPAGTIPLTNPVILDDAGRATIYWQGTYKLVLKDRFGYLVDTIDLFADGAEQLTSELASPVGATHVAYGVYQTVDDALGETISVKKFGAKGDGTTNDTDRIIAAMNDTGLSQGGVLTFPYGMYSVATAIQPATPILLRGDRAVMKAAANAGLQELFWPTAMASAEGMIFDGNRMGGGMSHDTAYVVYLPYSNMRLSQCEIRGGTRYGIALGSNAAVTDIEIDRCWIHDNGGITGPGSGPGLTGTGIGVGIGRIGSMLPTNVKVINCTIERNHNTVSTPGDSTAINGLGSGSVVTGNYIIDNYNVNGGQIAVSGGNPGDHTSIVTNNVIRLTGTFGGDLTCGIEVDADNVVVDGNIIEGMTSDGVRLESTSTGIIVADNVITCAMAGVNLINSGGTGPGKVKITGNMILSAATGIASQISTTGQIFAENNYIDASVATPIAGISNFTRLRNNVGFAPVVTTGVVAGASPYQWPTLPYEVTYVLTTAAGITSQGLDGVGLSIAVGVPIVVKPSHTLVTTWSGTAPTFAIVPVQ